MFVEILFPRTLFNWSKIEGIYDSSLYAKGKSSLNTTNSQRDLEHPAEPTHRSDSETTDSGEEFNEELDLVRIPVSLQTLKKKRQQTTKRKPKRKDRDSDDSGSESEILNDSTDDDHPNESTNKKRSQKRKEKIAWSFQEDECLREMYELYAGIPSVFDIIAMSSQLLELGGQNPKTSHQVEDRVNQLKLHLRLSSEDRESSPRKREETEEQTYEQVVEGNSFSSQPPTETTSRDEQDARTIGLPQSPWEEARDEIEESNEDSKWKRIDVAPKVKPKKIRKLVKRNRLSKPDTDSDGDLEKEDQNLVGKKSTEAEAGKQVVLPSHSVILDSDDED